jgi:hypothetical protein
MSSILQPLRPELDVSWSNILCPTFLFTSIVLLLNITATLDVLIWFNPYLNNVDQYSVVKI